MKKVLFIIIVIFGFFAGIYIVYHKFLSPTTKYGTFKQIAKLNYEHSDADAIKLQGGRILVLGNDLQQNQPSEIYDYKNNSVHKFNFFDRIQIFGKGILLPDNKLLLIDVCNLDDSFCFNYEDYNKNMAVYDLNHNKVQHYYKFSVPGDIIIYDYFLMENGNVFMIVENIMFKQQTYPKVCIYDPIKNDVKYPKNSSLRIEGSIPKAIQVSNDEILIFSDRSKILKYNVSTNTLSETKSENNLYNSSYTHIKDKILILGSSKNYYADNNYNLIYNIETDTINRLPSMITKKGLGSNFSNRYVPLENTISINSDYVLISGGRGTYRWYNSGGSYLRAAEIYDNNKNEFIQIRDMNCPRAGHNSFVMEDGSVLLIGGKTVPDCKCIENSIELFKFKERKK